MTVAGAVHRITSESSFEAISLDRHAAKLSSISASDYAACLLFNGFLVRSGSMMRFVID
jgi:hypothetical protein